LPHPGDSGRFEAISAPKEDPSREADSLTKKEVKRLSPTDRLEIEHKNLVKRLEKHLDIVRGERNEAVAEAKELRPLIAKVATLEEREKLRRGTYGIASLAMIVGGGLISSAPHLSGWVGGLGWGLLGLAAIALAGKAFFNIK